MFEKISLFENLKLNEWYKYLLYIAGIILIPSFFLDVKIAIKFSFITIFMGIILWIINKIFHNIKNDHDWSKFPSLEGSKRKERNLICFYYLEVFVILFIWLYFIRNMILF